ncbi:MAG: PAS domain S-box protein [Nannocystaceae bacterium]
MDTEPRFSGLARRLGVVFCRIRTRPALGIEMIDDAVLDLLGYSAQHMQAEPMLLRRIIHPDDREYIDSAQGVTAPGRIQMRFRHCEGYVVSIEAEVEPWTEGDRGGFNAALRPVVEGVGDSTLERASASDRVVDAWLGLVTASTPSILFFVDHEHVFRRVYRSTADAKSRFSEAIIGATVGDAFPDFPGILAAVTRALHGHRVREGLRMRGTTIELHCAPLRDGDGEVHGAMGLVLDLTRQVSLDDARRDQEAYFHSVIQTVNDGILVNDPDGVIEYANDRLARLLGTTASEMIGRRIFDYMDPESASQARENLQRRRGGAEDEFDFRFRRRDGTEFWSWVCAKPLYDGSGAHRGSLVAITDITRRKQAEDAFRQAHEELELRVIERTEELSLANEQLKVEVLERRRAEEAAIQANRIKSAFLASMSHELRTPLNAIIGYAELITDAVHDDGNDAYTDDLQRILSAATHLLSLINDVLDLSKIEAAKMEIHMERFVLGELVREVSATSMPLALKNDNRLTIHCDAEEREIISDRTKVKQILLNLISNACKFTRKGTVEVRGTCSILDDVDWLTFTITDTGIGIPSEKLAAIFQAFTQADERVSVNYGGTGLGLTISRRLAQMLGGDVGVRSIVGHGSTFTLSLPLPREL